MSTAVSERAALQRDLYDSALALLESEKTRDAILRMSGDAPFPDAAWRAAVAAGWGLTLLDPAHGGLGLGLSEAAAIFRAAGRGLCRGPLHDLVIALPLLANAGSASTRDRLLGGIEGRALVVSAEAPAPPYGRGDRAVTLRHGVLEGEVELVPFAASADLFVLVAHDGTAPALVVVPAAAVTRDRTISHDPCVDRGRVTLRSVRVSPDDVIASGDDAAVLRSRIDATLRLMVAAELAGVTAAITDMSVEYAKVREQFGRPIAGFQAVRHMLARMAQRTVSVGNVADAAAADAEAEPARLAEIAALAKAYATPTARWVAEEGLQVHGGIGFTSEYPLHLYMRRALTLESVTGESSALTLEIGRATLARA